jgi:heterotetrameric sarcosine oxidase beta subunit
LKARRDVVVVGAGIVGLMAAHHLVKRGMSDVLVVDRAPSLLLGASGRNGGGIRAQWTSVENIELARRSIEQFKALASETGQHTWFRQGGYLFLARTEDQLAQLRKAADFQNRHGVRTRLVAPAEARDIVPELNASGIVGGTYNPDDGTLFPWPVVHGVADRLKHHGVPIELNTAVTGFRRRDGRITAVETERGEIEAEHVVLAAGAWSRELAATAGIEIPTHPERHEILVTEALKPFLKPMVVDLANGLYCSQAMRGELVGGLGYPHHEGASWSSTFEFLQAFAAALTRLLPSLGGVNVLRQWAGSYDMSPDHKPILGRTPEVENLYVACGLAGHGFMIAPMAGQLTAELVTQGRTSLDIRKFRLGRFAEGDIEPETMVIG